MDSSQAIGETTGTCREATAFIIEDELTEVTTPTNPRSAGVPSTNALSGFANNVPDFLPDIAMALTPSCSNDCATAGPTSPARTLSTTSNISGVVTRKPPTNSEVIAADFSAASIWGPPPCTITSSTPSLWATAIAFAKAPFSSFMAWPPNLTTIMWRKPSSREHNRVKDHW